MLCLARVAGEDFLEEVTPQRCMTGERDAAVGHLERAFQNVLVC